MIQITFKRWTFDADPPATQTAHDSILLGSPEICSCLHCKNFAAARSHIYPPEALALFDQLGIPIDHESEIWEAGPVEGGKCLYGGWFHFVGSNLIGRDAKVKLSDTTGSWDLESITPEFSLGLTKELALVPAAMSGRPILQIEFQALVPWVLEETYPNPKNAA